MRTTLLVALYGLSGAVGLAWQVVQVRAFVPVFGADAEAIAAVTACFLGGLGLGGALARRLLARISPLRLYGGLEILVGLWGAALPWLLSLSAPLMVEILRAAGEGLLATGLRLLLALVLVGPMAAALGATFPAVAVALDADRRPERTGLAYGVNAIGAAAGALLAGLVLPWALGIRLGSATLGLGNVLVGVAALVLARREPRAAPVPTAAVGPAPPRWIGWVAGLTGFVGMGLELCWSRMSAPLLAARSGSDAVAFSAVLAAVVLGIGLGGLLARRVRGGLGLPLALLQGGLCLLTLATLEPLRHLALGARHIEWLEGLLPVLPALLQGATFPLLANALHDSGTPASRGLGRLYAVNTVGAVLGSLSTGFVLMPLLGAQRMAVLLAGIAGLVALASLARAGRPKATAAWGILGGAAVLIFLVVAPPVAGSRLIPPSEVVIDAIEGRQTSTLVSAPLDGRDRALTSSGHRIGASAPEARVNDHALRALGPAGLHPAPRRVLLVGLGTGATAKAFLDLPTVKHLTVVELDGSMKELLHHFGTEGILADPRLRVVDGDGRWFIRADTERWDVIAVDAYGPRTASATFYTEDFYREAAPRLAEGGLLFVRFNPPTLTEPGPLASFLQSLFVAFPEGMLVFVERGLFGLVGTHDPDALSIAERRIVADRQSAAALVRGHRPHTDDRPVWSPDGAVVDFKLVMPYWQARQGEANPPWMRGGPPPPPR